MEAEVEGIAAEDVAHPVAADDDELEALLLRNAFQARGTHLPGGADGEALARDEEGFAAMDALPEIRHEVAEGARLPALVEGIEAFRDTIGGGSDLVGVDRVALPAGPRGIPDDERLPADDMRRAARGRGIGGTGPRQVCFADAGFQARGPDLVFTHRPVILPCRDRRRNREALRRAEIGLAKALFPGELLRLLEEPRGALTQEPLAFLLVVASLPEEVARGLARVDAIGFDPRQSRMKPQVFGGLAQLRMDLSARRRRGNGARRCGLDASPRK